MKHVMIDLETMGKKSNSAIISIAAVEYDITTGNTGRIYTANVDLQSCLNAGLTVEADTIMWWVQQSKEAQQALTIAPIHIRRMLFEFQKFIDDCGPDICLWGNSARFDLGKLADAFEKCGLKINWNYENERCVRTFASLKPEIKKNLVRKGVHHKSLCDCLHQIEYCWLTNKALGIVID